MIVNSDNISEVVAALDREDVWVIDTETTGLRPYHGDEPFSIIILAGDSWFYFNGIEYEGETVPIVDFGILSNLLIKSRSYVFHNLKFDLSMLANAGLHISAESNVYCTMSADRVVCDNRLYHKGGFSLGGMAPRYGAEKNDAVEAYILKHKLFEDVEIPGKKSPVRIMFYNKVPFDLIVPYGGDDVKATLKIKDGQDLLIAKSTERNVLGQPSKKNLLDNEMKLIRVVWDMERYGAKLDKDYVLRAIDHYETKSQDYLDSFKLLTGLDYEPKPSLYKIVFAAEQWVYTAKGNPSFSGDVLDTFTGPAAQIVNKLRDAKHQLDTYRGLLYHADADDVVHANFNQHMTRTGRFSSSNPNLQNMERPTTEGGIPKFTPRRSIIPRPGSFLFMPDYNQMEYRMMLDYAGAHDLIREVNGGLDVHTAMAERIGVDRKTMKNGNFAILYGSGNEALAKTLRGSVAQAKALRQAIHEGAPEIGQWVADIKAAVRRRGYVYNWLGRVFHFKADEEYKATNAMIQGGCADTVKMAMVKVDEYLRGTPAKMILTIHDELVFEIPYGEERLTKGICDIMESIYKPINGLPLTVSAEWSDTNLAEKKKWDAASQADAGMYPVRGFL